MTAITKRQRTLDDNGFPPSPKITTVIFDFHCTLVDPGDPKVWLRNARAQFAAAQEQEEEGHPPRSESELEPSQETLLLDFLNRVWERVRDLDPTHSRDLNPDKHEEIFKLAMELKCPIKVGPRMIHHLYSTVSSTWTCYADTIPTLSALREAGTKMVLLSNVGFDIRPVLRREGMLDFFEGIVLSCEAGVVKPAREIFQLALDSVKASSEEALMVGDNWEDDGGAARIGVRTLVLPRTHRADNVHGLDLVLNVLGM